MLELVESGPVYPALPQLNKYRRKFRNGLHGSEGINEYGMAVKAAFRALQRQELAREVPTFRSNSVSGTFHNDPKKIKQAIRNRQIAELESGVRQDRAARKDEDIIAAYEEAIEEKRKRNAQPVAKKPPVKPAKAVAKPSKPKKPQIVFKEDKGGKILAFHGRKEVASIERVSLKRMDATIKIGKKPIVRRYGSLLFVKLDLMKRLEMCAA